MVRNSASTEEEMGSGGMGSEPSDRSESEWMRCVGAIYSGIEGACASAGGGVGMRSVDSLPSMLYSKILVEI